MNLRMEGTFLRSAVARRVFFLFVLSAFVPAAMLAGLSYSHVRSVVNDHAHRQLAQAGSAHARALYDRLLGAHFLLNANAAPSRRGLGLPDLDQPAWRRVFQRAYLMVDGKLVAANSESHSSPPIGPETAAHLARGEVALLATESTSSAAPWLAVAIDPKQLARGVLMAQFEPAYLWGDSDDLPYQTNICVFNAAGARLYCSNGTLDTTAGAADRRSEHAANWSQATSWLFLKPKFGVADWTVVALQPSALVSASLAQVSQMFFGVTLLALLLVALLSVVQIRRTLVPLERLMEGTRRIAGEEFERPVVVERDDEFGQLADSLNTMASRLGRQIKAMRALSAIDQEILSHLNIEQIISRVHARLLEILPQAAPSVVVFDRAAGCATVYSSPPGEGQITQAQVAMETGHLSELGRRRLGFWLDPDESGVPGFVAIQAVPGPFQYFVLPILWRSEVDAALVIGVREQAMISGELIEQLRDLGNRIGVALAAHAREAQLEFRAHHDDLTGLPNRALLHERLRQELAHARRDGSQLALLFIDLDRFKSVNDTLGHDGGDQLLQTVAERLLLRLRECDTVARVGGDEFVVLLTDLGGPRQAAKVAGKILGTLAERFQVAGNDCFVGASVGVAVYPADGATPDELLKHADIAMSRAKTSRPGSFVFFEESMNVEQRQRAVMEHELHLAIVRNQLSVHYQPRIALADGRMLGAEALLRWQHPELGSVSPAIFIPLAEEVGLIDEIGPWVMLQVCRQIADWQAAGQVTGVVAVNVSGREFKANNLVAQVQRTLEATGLAATALELELTEGVLIDDVGSVIEVLGQLKQIGVSVALDDFGTGYSSMAYLRRLPIDRLKIDQSFVRDLVEDEGARSIVQAIIALAHALGKSVVAEGVETQQQADLLRAWNCDEAQGYYFSRPLPAPALQAFREQALARWPDAGAALPLGVP